MPGYDGIALVIAGYFRIYQRGYHLGYLLQKQKIAFIQDRLLQKRHTLSRYDFSIEAFVCIA